MRDKQIIKIYFSRLWFLNLVLFLHSIAKSSWDTFIFFSWGKFPLWKSAHQSNVNLSPALLFLCSKNNFCFCVGVWESLRSLKGGCSWIFIQQKRLYVHLVKELLENTINLDAPKITLTLFASVILCCFFFKSVKLKYFRLSRPRISAIWPIK